jgi:SAM-dependent methyltransferase
MEILSPVTGTHPTTLVFELRSEIIENLYAELGLDVSRFFTNAPSVQLRQCQATGYRFYYPFSIFGDDKFYEDLQLAFNGYYVENRWEHATSLQLISSGDNVLEVGCGSGYFLQALKEKGVRAEGLELNTKACEKAAAKGLVVFRRLLEEHRRVEQKKYDVTCSFQVLEHVTDVHSFISSSLEILKPGGKMIIGVPNNNPYIFKHDVYHTLNLPPHHAGLWNKESFVNLQHFFPIKMMSFFTEPLQEYKEWYTVQKNYYKKQNKVIAALLQVIPRPLYKIILKGLGNAIEGRNIVAVFSKQ